MWKAKKANNMENLIDRKLAENKSLNNIDFELEQLRKARKRSKDKKLTFADKDISFEY